MTPYNMLVFLERCMALILMGAEDAQKKINRMVPALKVKLMGRFLSEIDKQVTGRRRMITRMHLETRRIDKTITRLQGAATEYESMIQIAQAEAESQQRC